MKKRNWFLALLMVLAVTMVRAQEGDTTIYQAVEEMPRFPGCEQLDTTLTALNKCAEQQLLRFVYSQVGYPVEARRQGLEGNVVVSFVVELDGSLSSPQIVKDIGGGCGLEVIRVVNLMNERGLRWRPGFKEDGPVRVRMTLPVRFQLEEAKPYVLAGRDTIYVRYDTPPGFIGGDEALSRWLAERLDYPTSGLDSCRVGTIDMQLQIGRDGQVRILDMTDYNDLGFDFWYEAIDAATSTIGQWDVAVFEGRKVPSAYDITLSFAPNNEACREVVTAYQEAGRLVQEGAELFNADDQEAGLAKLDEALARFPNDANFLFIRGQMLLEADRLREACRDLRKGSEIALVNWYNDILPLICR